MGDALRVPTSGAFAVLSDNEHFQVFLNALQSRTAVKMLSAPHIIAADNREAHILVGESIPILTSTVTNVLTDNNGSAVNSVQYRDTGKILTVLPQVNSLGLVNLQIRQEVSAVGAASFGSTNSPSFTTREAETTVVVNDGDSVLIGGIIDDQVSNSRDGTPFLMDIPVLGALFRDDHTGAARTELLILITPYVIRNRDEAREVTGAFSENVKGLRVFSRKLQQRRAIRRLHEPQAESRPTASPSAKPAEPAVPVPAEAVP
jgi:general secretion pathway protein D